MGEKGERYRGIGLLSLTQLRYGPSRKPVIVSCYHQRSESTSSNTQFLTDEYPFAIYALRPGDPVDAVAVKFVDEGFPGLTLFPGRTLQDRSDALNSLVVVWICAKEKARRSKPILQPVRVMLHWKPMEKISDTGEAIVESYKLEKTTIDIADRDEVIHCIGGVDLRKWGLSLFSASS